METACEGNDIELRLNSRKYVPVESMFSLEKTGGANPRWDEFGTFKEQRRLELLDLVREGKSSRDDRKTRQDLVNQFNELDFILSIMESN